MKHIKPYKIFENSQEPQHPGFPETEEEIDELCEYYEIENYTINDDLSIDVDGDVDLTFKYGKIKYLPLNFNYVSGDFNCDNYLISLRGSPKEVGGGFICDGNELISLKGGPSKVGGGFICDGNELTSLEGSPKEVGGDFDCSYNKLTSLNGMPNLIKGDFGCNNNNLSIFNISGKVFRSLFLHNNPIFTVIYTFINKDNSKQLLIEFNHYRVTDGEVVYIERLEMFCSDFDLEMPVLDEAKEYYKIV